MARCRDIRVVPLALALGALAAILVVPGHESLVLFLAPAIVLLASLLTGTYVGEDGLHRLAAARVARRPRRARALRVPAPASRARAAMPRGGRLVATSLAVRPPPRALTAIT